MATITLDITIGKGANATTHAHTIDSDDVPLLLIEAAQDGKMGLLRESIADFLDLSPEVSKHLTMRHVKQIGKAIEEASKSPNGA